MKKFEILHHDQTAKHSVIEGPYELRLYVDRDDVPTLLVDRAIQVMVDELNFAFDRHEYEINAILHPIELAVADNA